MTITRENTFEEIEQAMKAVPYPKRPSRPLAGRDMSSTEARKYAYALEAYEMEMEEYQAARTAANEEANRLLYEWCEKLREEYNHLNDATFQLVYQLAYDMGHAYGYPSVRDYTDTYAGLAEKIIQANK